MEEDDIPFLPRRNECVGIEYRMVFAIVGGGIYDGFFSSPVGMALLAGCCTWGVYRILGAVMVYTAKSFSPPDA